MQLAPTTRGVGPFTPLIRVISDNGFSEYYTVGGDQDTEEKAFLIAEGIYQICRNDVIGRLRNVEQIFKNNT